MKKHTVIKFVLSFLIAGNVFAQSLDEGKRHLYAQRYQSAKSVFEKLVSTNPNDLDAVYWLGQTYIETEDIPAAKSLYEKTLSTNGNAPIVLVGMGHVELYENKKDMARQRFETALTMTVNKRKGNDPNILNAIGRANADAKNGNLDYAVQVLKEAAEKDSKNADILLNLGNAYRKKDPGKAGGEAYTSYQTALKATPAFAIASYRTAKLFETQKNWPVFLEHMNYALEKDPSFAPAYYDLYYYYLSRLDFTKAEEYAQKFIANSDANVDNKYLACQTLWAKKDYQGAISCSKAMIAEAAQKGAKIKPTVHKLLAYSYVGAGDTAAGKEYIDRFFELEKPENLVGADYELKATVYSKIPGQEDAVVQAIMEGVKMDTVYSNKIATLKAGAALFKAKGDRKRAGELLEAILKIAPNPNQRDVFDPGLEYYFSGSYPDAIRLFTQYTEKWPDETFGWQWKFNTERAIDTSMEQGMFVPSGEKLLEVCYRDSVKNKTTILQTLAVLASYYVNIKNDLPKGLEYLKKYLYLDPENAAIKENIGKLEKAIQGSKKPGT